MLVDSHCHLKDSRYGKSPLEVAEDSKNAGVSLFINIATSLEDSSESSKICNSIPYVYGTVGIYPHSDLGTDVGILQSGLEKIIEDNSKIVGVGECGIDISDHSLKRELEEQIKVFEMQVELAVKAGLPVIIHNRNGDDKVLEIISRYKNSGLKAVAHCFSSSWDVAEKFLDLGVYLSFSGMLTYPSRNDLREVVSKVPDDMFLLETDSPWLPPQGHRGELNYPKYVRIVAEKVSQVKEKPYLTVASLSTANACRLFNINL
ncbi:MAG: Hydrolase, TatD family [candidate division WWE3 bacterium GW2011_GWF2_41_45]|uniref:Hydrolase TatD n=3 Tax=Katanobacteria TaxID=422282 RepID=A0A1F4VZD4_UNCKA|nr:MAG: Hydrolase, TatD family [candidate division WWE3 bacterium GW2011_GWC2_41_23]KKS09559.1 MAG: Hydrolase, TatD family [candidate division WWE3 bacterium GW2011_GWF2_41_45]KKS12127.1 MAG: Hydrolase, TatD family [candidate division WWE3 bacterium GW2011_GWF1_41_53]KKS28074.1 MAG: TatD family hydrolase, TatD DNase family protein [candidate division WWE3 bacterium GW2011_GWC1_42_102]KKS28863.1 MAG: Hydrolase, TatD family [candidate division WWE3 bacterium GW2011_GWD2_42_11]KKS50663.1 MAG: Hyd